ncbi:hypothetical protein Dsin_023962 [Dipteronia sinensis]|uniref:KIB1-4 beta-propeller domain-containing protein n=1 Tax=Dipteronia sinensis TaxID=43782 RepID=A0AAE0E2L4_9ROSI|nr:hypothetical protein Dsin_023962 [Dipteronia sinensis]
MCPSRPLFFYCPFTNEIIRLPELEELCFSYRATFSTAPTSSDCVIFVYQPYPDSWSSLCFDGHFWEIKNVAYAKGVFYCAFDPILPYMGAYNPALQEWKIHPYPPFIHRRDYRDLYLFDSPTDDKDLLLAYYTSGGYYPDFVYRFDQSQMEWFKIKNFISVSSCNEDGHGLVEIETLNNRVLFRSSIQYISLPAEGEASRLANTIHWCSSKRWVWSGGVRSCPQIYDWVDQRFEKKWSKFWIHPPHAHKFITGCSELEPALD